MEIIIKMKKYNWELCGIVLWYSIYIGTLFTLVLYNIDVHQYTRAAVWGLIFVLNLLTTMFKIHRVNSKDTKKIIDIINN
jgi:hypothetical protein